MEGYLAETNAGGENNQGYHTVCGPEALLVIKRVRPVDYLD